MLPAGTALTGLGWRPRAWLVVTAALHLAMLTITVALLPQAGVDQVDSVAILLVLAMGPPAGLLALELRRPSARKPHEWPVRSLFVACPQSMALAFPVFAALGKQAPAPWLRLLLVTAVPLIPTGTAELARRAALRHQGPDSGVDIEMFVRRRARRRPWYYTDRVTISDRELVITVRSGWGQATWNPKTERIALAGITAVGVGPALPQDSPWITLSDGRGLSVPPGDVVVIRCGDARRAIPVADAPAFAEMLRIRVARARGTPAAGSAVDVEIETPPATEHIPELRPAPEPYGPAAHPVPGPAAPPRTGPGMAARWALGLPLALLGIVGAPVGSLFYGGLIPSGPGLERHRLDYCLLWIALATAIWLRSRHQPRYWPAWALMSSLGTAAIVAVEGSAPALLGPLLAVSLTGAGRRVLLRPIATDLGASRLEIPVRGPNFTLLVQRDRMVLELRAGAGGAAPQAVPLAELAVAQPGQLAGVETRWWPLPGALRTRLGRGPVLRLVSGRQQWLLPVDAPRELAAIVRARATTAPRLDARPLPREQWPEVQSWAARQLTTTRSRLKQRTVHWRVVAAVPVAFFGSALGNEAIARGAGPSTGFPVVAAVALAIAAALVGDWIRVRARLRVAEDNALPAGSPAWGELRPDHAPLEGWQPWWTAPRTAPGQGDVDERPRGGSHLASTPTSGPKWLVGNHFGPENPAAVTGARPLVED